MGLKQVGFRSVCLALVMMILAACGSGSSSGSSTDPVNDPPSQISAPELSGLRPANVVLDLQAGESTDLTLSFNNTGDAPLTYTLASTDSWMQLPSNGSGSVAASGSANLSVAVTCGASDLSGTLQLSTNDSDEGNNSIPVTVTCAPLPTDLALARVTLNQAARAFDSDAGAGPQIGLIAGRDILVRAFVTGSGQPPDARVLVSRPGRADLTFAMDQPPSIGATVAAESLLNASHHVVVPGSAISADASLEVQLAPFNTPVRYPASGTGLALNAVDAGPFEVTFVPVTFNGQTPSLDGATYIRNALEVLPIGEVDIEIRAPYTFTGTYDLEDVLMEISDLRNLDGSSRLYHAVIIPPSGSTSSTAGIGFVGYPVSVSVDLGGSSYVIAHEIGHNLSLGHAPGCNAPDGDSAYPHTDGAVVTWGYNINNSQLVEPTVTRRDFMSYCNDLWVSDYHFDKAIDYLDQAPVSSASPAGLGLVIRGRLDHQQVSDVQMLPTPNVIMQRRVSGQDQAYEFIAWNAAGEEIVREPFEVHSVVDAGTGAAFVVHTQMPDSAIDHYEVRRSGAILHDVRIAPARPEILSADVRWHVESADIRWRTIDGQALVIRDVQGRVVSVDRSGHVMLATNNLSGSLATLSLQLLTQGDLSQPQQIAAGQDRRINLTR